MSDTLKREDGVLIEAGRAGLIETRLHATEDGVARVRWLLDVESGQWRKGMLPELLPDAEVAKLRSLLASRPSPETEASARCEREHHPWCPACEKTHACGPVCKVAAPADGTTGKGTP